MKTEILGSTNSSYWTFKIVVIQNENTITIENFLGRSSTAGSSYFMGDYTLNYVCGTQIYSENLYKSSDTIAAGGWYSLGSHTFDVQDVSEEIYISGSMSTSAFNPSSASASGYIEETISKLNIGINGEWKKAIPYIGVNGEWKKCKTFFGVNGEWKKGK